MGQQHGPQYQELIYSERTTHKRAGRDQDPDRDNMPMVGEVPRRLDSHCGQLSANYWSAYDFDLC